MLDTDAEAVITFIDDHLDPRYKTPLGMLPTAWPVFRRVLISEGYGGDDRGRGYRYSSRVKCASTRWR